MAKRVNRFSAKGKLNLSEGVIYETKKVGKDEITVEIPFFDILKDFDEKNVSISIGEEIAINGVTVESEEI